MDGSKSHFFEKGNNFFIIISRQSWLDPDPVCPERLYPDPDPVCPERLYPDPDPVCPERLNPDPDPDPVNIRPDPKPCL